MSERVDSKAFQEVLGSLGFIPGLAKSEMEKAVERQRAYSQRDWAKRVSCLTILWKESNVKTRKN